MMGKLMNVESRSARERFPSDDIASSSLSLVIEDCQKARSAENRTAASSPDSNGPTKVSSPSLRSYRFRPIQPQDRQVIQALHEEWFPVTYHDEFYDDLVRHGSRQTARGDQMPSLDDCGVCDDYASGNDEGTDVGCLAELGSDETAQSDGTADRMQQPGKTLFTCVAVGGDEEHSARICGCVVGCFLRARSHLSPRLRNLLLPSHHERAFYIMTLGVVRSRRKSGLGSHLVQLCQRLVEQDPDCGVLYLHVITFNAGAIRLYENLGFYRVEEIVDYYTIGGKQYNALLFAKYFHGNRGHRDLFSLAKETAAVFWRQVVGTLPVLLRYLSRPLSQQAPRIQHHD